LSSARRDEVLGAEVSISVYHQVQYNPEYQTVWFSPATL